MDENDLLKKLIVLFKSEGYIGKEAVEKAEAELQRRREHEELQRRREHELQMKKTATGETHFTLTHFAHVFLCNLANLSYVDAFQIFSFILFLFPQINSCSVMDIWLLLV